MEVRSRVPPLDCAVSRSDVTIRSGRVLSLSTTPTRAANRTGSVSAGARERPIHFSVVWTLVSMIAIMRETNRGSFGSDSSVSH